MTTVASSLFSAGLFDAAAFYFLLFLISVNCSFVIYYGILLLSISISRAFSLLTLMICCLFNSAFCLSSSLFFSSSYSFFLIFCSFFLSNFLFVVWNWLLSFSLMWLRNYMTKRRSRRRSISLLKEFWENDKLSFTARVHGARYIWASAQNCIANSEPVVTCFEFKVWEASEMVFMQSCFNYSFGLSFSSNTVYLIICQKESIF